MIITRESNPNDWETLVLLYLTHYSEWCEDMFSDTYRQVSEEFVRSFAVGCTNDYMYSEHGISVIFKDSDKFTPQNIEIREIELLLDLAWEMKEFRIDDKEKYFITKMRRE